MSELSFPPLLDGREATAGRDPFDEACELARAGCDSGLVIYAIAPDRLRAAMVFAPEMPLSDAVIMLPLCGIGFQNALGALAPPEVGVHLDWAGGIYVNGGWCGEMRMAAEPRVADQEPDWLVIGLELILWPESDMPGETPDRTSLYAEGCSEIEPERLLEAWTKHTLVWLNRWDDDGVEALHREWTGLAHQIGKPVTLRGKSGTFIGVDENFGLLLKTETKTQAIPLTRLLEP